VDSGEKSCKHAIFLAQSRISKLFGEVRGETGPGSGDLHYEVSPYAICVSSPGVLV
jgi:hypothetical protein